MTQDTGLIRLRKLTLERFSLLRREVNQAWPYVWDFIVHAVAQPRVLQKAYPGIMHAFLFWGVTIQIFGTAIILMQMQLFVPFVELPLPRGTGYLVFELMMDLAGAAILAGVFMATIRRVILRPQSLRKRWDDNYALGLLVLIPITGYILEGTRLLARAPAWASWSPVGSLVAGGLLALGLSVETALRWHPFLFWAHMSLGLIFVVSIPFTKLRHLVFTPLNIIVHPRRNVGTPALIENIEEAETLGVGRVADFTSTQLLSLDACLRCGRCEEVCPVTASGMAYSPCTFIHSLRETMVRSLITSNGQDSDQLLGDTMPADTPWSCTTCGACQLACPAFINPIDAIIDLRRHQALMTGQVPKSVGNVLRSLERQGNPWSMPPAERTAWAQGLNVKELKPGDETDVLLFMGCTASYDSRNNKVARTLVDLLQQAGSEFAILGQNEFCCGDAARRLGHEYLFQEFARQNIDMLAQIKFKRIVTQCPHCLNAFKNEYPQLGGNYQVQHYTEYLMELLSTAELAATNGNGLNGRLTYHDPCYLGRYNQTYQAPRRLLDKVKVNRVEMSRQGKNSFCCGGGGGQMWLESKAETRINRHRLEDALHVRADYVATACPYCLLMFEDAIRSKGLGEQIQVLDIAEVLAQYQIRQKPPLEAAEKSTKH